MALPLLLGLHYSPWTIRARWALDHHKVEFRYREHVPMLGEGSLRRRARRANVEVPSVPLFVTGDQAYGDSYAIMCHADQIGREAKLGAESPECGALVETLEPGLHACRIRVTKRTLEDRDALTEAATAAVPAFIAPLMRPVAAMGARHIARKYAFDPKDADNAPVVVAFRHVQEAVGDGPFVGEEFGARDIVCAAATNALLPHPSIAAKMGPRSRAAWTDEDLARDFVELINWRDEIYAKHFPAA